MLRFAHNSVVHLEGTLGGGVSPPWLSCVCSWVASKSAQGNHDRSLLWKLRSCFYVNYETSMMKHSIWGNVELIFYDLRCNWFYLILYNVIVNWFVDFKFVVLNKLGRIVSGKQIGTWVLSSYKYRWPAQFSCNWPINLLKYKGKSSKQWLMN